MPKLKTRQAAYSHKKDPEEKEKLKKGYAFRFHKYEADQKRITLHLMTDIPRRSLVRFFLYTNDAAGQRL